MRLAVGLRLYTAGGRPAARITIADEPLAVKHGYDDPLRPFITDGKPFRWLQVMDRLHSDTRLARVVVGPSAHVYVLGQSFGTATVFRYCLAPTYWGHRIPP